MNKIALRTSSKCRDNKGFSLVELIIVIAIMAVLTAILAPQLLRYVERSRQAKDATTLDEVYRALTIALADDTTYTAVNVATSYTATYSRAGVLTIVGSGTGATTAANNAFATEIHRTLGGTLSNNAISNLPALVSRARNADVAFTITIAANGHVTVSYT